MSMEPETDRRREPGPLTPGEWASWALFGDDAARIPATLQPLHDRVAQAIRQAVEEARKPLLEEIEWLKADADLYHRGYAAMGAADISEYLALCATVKDCLTVQLPAAQPTTTDTTSPPR